MPFEPVHRSRAERAVTIEDKQRRFGCFRQIALRSPFEPTPLKDAHSVRALSDAHNYSCVKREFRAGIPIERKEFLARYHCVTFPPTVLPVLYPRLGCELPSAARPRNCRVVFSSCTGGKLRIRRFAAAAATVAAGALILSGCAAPQSEIVEGSSLSVAWNQPFYSYNGVTSFGNATANNNITYATLGGFNYYDNTPALVKDTSFGTLREDLRRPAGRQVHDRRRREVV